MWSAAQLLFCVNSTHVLIQTQTFIKPTFRMFMDLVHQKGKLLGFLSVVVVSLFALTEQELICCFSIVAVVLV